MTSSKFSLIFRKLLELVLLHIDHNNTPSKTRLNNDINISPKSPESDCFVRRTRLNTTYIINKSVSKFSRRE